MDWIRGVNMGGWLVLERFITPYLFAVTTCHLRGDFCFYPNQLGAPPTTSPYYQVCDLYHCQPHLTQSVAGVLDYPVDEYTLLAAFPDKDVARRYLEFHWDNFVTRQDVRDLKAAGVTHIRVPLPHWIFTPASSSSTSSAFYGNDDDNDVPYVDGGWLYFVRFVSWCREEGMQVWPDLHTAPGSQNGFDNSGQLLAGNPTCSHWSDSPLHVQRTLQILHAIAKAIVDDGLQDVVTGIGILNEPFGDCDMTVVRDYNQQALEIVRNILGPNTSIYQGDMFNATLWNDGWWKDEPHTYLDSHYYHVFAEQPRALSPRQHIAYVCEKNERDTVGCCYDDAPTNKVPTKGMSRIIGEWSASYDTLVVAMLDVVMKGIATNGTAPFFDRQISTARKAFLRNFVEAQMVAYEASSAGVSSGWFYWTFKMEGGAFAEWDFLRGIKEGWIPKVPARNVSSEELYGDCESIIFRTKDDMSIVHEFPVQTADSHNWQGVDIDDDVVVSHGASLSKTSTKPTTPPTTTNPPTTKPTTAKKETTSDKTVDSDVIHDNATTTTSPTSKDDTTSKQEEQREGRIGIFSIVAFLFFGYAIRRVFFDNYDQRRRRHYSPVDSSNSLTLAV